MDTQPATQVTFEQVYAELRGIAHKHIGAADTLNATALVHELYLRMAHRADMHFTDKRAFYFYAARAMRNLLIDRARTRLREKRGGVRQLLELDESAAAQVWIRIEETLELDNLLTLLQAEDQRAAEVVELHHFAGLTLEQTAEVLGVVRRTVDRDLEFARSFLKAHWNV